jgi:hypothetical protein
MYSISQSELADLLVDFINFADSNSHLTDIEAAEEFVESIADGLTEQEDDDDIELEDIV